MASLVSIWDEIDCLADRILLDQYATALAVGKSSVIHNLAFELPPPTAYISWTREVGGVEDGCFHLASLANSLRFLLLGFILEILNEYEITPF